MSPQPEPISYVVQGVDGIRVQPCLVSDQAEPGQRQEFRTADFPDALDRAIRHANHIETLFPEYRVDIVNVFEE